MVGASLVRLVVLFLHLRWGVHRLLNCLKHHFACIFVLMCCSALFSTSTLPPPFCHGLYARYFCGVQGLPCQVSFFPSFQSCIQSASPFEPVRFCHDWGGTDVHVHNGRKVCWRYLSGPDRCSRSIPRAWPFLPEHNQDHSCRGCWNYDVLSSF